MIAIIIHLAYDLNFKEAAHVTYTDGKYPVELVQFYARMDLLYIQSWHYFQI